MAKTYILNSRRQFLAGAATVAIAAPYVISSTARAQNKVVYVNTWGGSWTAAEDAAFFKPFTAATGIEVRTATPVSYAKLKAQVTSGQYEWDISSPSQTQALRAEIDGLLEPIDWKIIDKNKVPENMTFHNAVNYSALSYNICYRTDKFPNGGPKSWADFWNVQKFPGNRSLYGGDAVVMSLAALLADGVPTDKMYPPDIDRAFKSLDKIKPHIKVWWTQGNQSQQLLRDGEVDMIAIWNARGTELKTQGTPVEVVWNGALSSMGTWIVAKGSPNKGAAWEFIQFAVQAQPQAEFAKRLFYGPSNPKAYEFLSPEVAKELPTYPPYLKESLIMDPVWGGENANKVEERFKAWIAS